MKRLFISGISGLLGNNLAQVLKSEYEVAGIYNEHPVTIRGVACLPCDILDEGCLTGIITDFKPDVVIHCASWTNVDRCEVEPEAAFRQNVTGTRNVTAAANRVAAKLVYISTDSVYSGVKGNHREEDPPQPRNHYGATKLAGEAEALMGREPLILRTNIFGWNIQEKESLAEWVINELSAGQRIKGFADVRFSGIYTLVLAELLAAALARNLTGVYNCVSRTSMTKLEFARQIARRCGLDDSLIEPISIDQYPFVAARGKDQSLSTAKIEAALEREVPTMDESLDRFCQDLRLGIPEMIRAGLDILAKDLIPYGRQAINDQDIQAVAHVLSYSHLTQGPKIAEFESALCGRTKANYAVAVNSGTSALHIACLAAGVGPGHEVVTSPITFVASANCALYCGARPVFADIDPRTYNMDPAALAARITGKTRAVIPVHFAGQSCDMLAIAEVVREAENRFGHQIFIIEDGCHALGSRYRVTEVGSCTYSDMTVMSFHPVKHITTGEGGVVFTNDTGLRRQLQFFRSHGITNDADELDLECCDRDATWQEQAPWYYQQVKLGYNYRITDIQCALGLSQLPKLDSFRSRRRQLVITYNEAFAGLPYVHTPFESELCDSNFHLYVLQFDFDRLAGKRRALMQMLRRRRIVTQVHYIPVHTQPYYQRNFGTGWGDCPIAEKYYQGCLSLPLFPALEDAQQKYVIQAIAQLDRGYLWT